MFKASKTFIICCFITSVASAALGIRNLSKSMMVKPFSSSFDPYLNVMSSGWRFLEVIFTMLPRARRACIHAKPFLSGTSRSTNKCESVTRRWLQNKMIKWLIYILSFHSRHYIIVTNYFTVMDINK